MTPPPPPPAPRRPRPRRRQKRCRSRWRRPRRPPVSPFVAPPPAAEPVASSAPAATIATPAPAGDHSNLRPVAYGVAIGAGVGLILGAVEGIVAIKKRNEFNDHRGPTRTTRSAAPEITDCNTTAPTGACKSIQDSWSRARTVSIVGFIAGGVLAGGAAALWVSRRPRQGTGRVQYRSRVRARSRFAWSCLSVAVLGRSDAA